MIRMVASDLDGTLLPDGAQSLSDETVSLIRKIDSLGIYFVAASGRHYANMKRLFRAVWEDIIFVSDNGSLITHRGEILDKTVIPRHLAHELILDLCGRSECDVMVSGIHSLYFHSKPRIRASVDSMFYEMKNTVTIVDDFLDLDEEMIKISAIVYDDKLPELEAALSPKWSEHFQIASVGGGWLDFTLTNKGEALDKLRERFKIKREETVAFGDNFNDKSMFHAVQYSYAMAGAKDEVRQSARYSCESVETVLNNLVSYLQ